MWLHRTLSACVLATAAWAGVLSDLLSDAGTVTGDETPGLSLEHANFLEQLHQEHTHLRDHHTHHKCKKHDPNKNNTHEKTSNIVKRPGYAAMPMSSSAGAVRDNFEDLSTISSLSPNFWVRKILPIRATDPKWNKNSDCFYDTRKKVRHYPSIPGHSCYTKEFSKRQEAWWNFWPEVRGDLQYAFDFVMWDEYEQYHETNSFWYLMLYLKTLVLRVSNPNDIAPRDPSAWRPHANRTNQVPPHNKEAAATGANAMPYASPGVHFGDYNIFGELNLNKTNQTEGGPLPGAAAKLDLDCMGIMELLKEYKEKLEHLEFLLNDFQATVKPAHDKQEPNQVEVVTRKTLK